MSVFYQMYSHLVQEFNFMTLSNIYFLTISIFFKGVVYSIVIK